MHFKQVQKRSWQTQPTEVSMATKVISSMITKARDIHGSSVWFPQGLHLHGPTWWYSDRMLCISATSSLEISFTTNVRSYDASSSPTHTPSSFLTGGLRARETCWLEDDVGRYTHAETFNLLRKSHDFCCDTAAQHNCIFKVSDLNKTNGGLRNQPMFLLCLSSQMHQSFAMQTCPLQSEWWRSPPPGACKISHKCKCRRRHTRREKAESLENRLFSIHGINWFVGGAGGRSQSYLIILVLDSKSLAQVPEHLRTVLLKFELSRKVLSKEQKVFHWISPSSRQV